MGTLTGLRGWVTGLAGLAALAAAACGGPEGSEKVEIALEFRVEKGASNTAGCGFLRNNDLVVAVLGFSAADLEEAPGGCDAVFTGAGSGNVGGAVIPISAFEVRIRAAGAGCAGLTGLEANSLAVQSFSFENDAASGSLACDSAGVTTPLPDSFLRTFACSFDDGEAPPCTFTLQNAEVAAGFPIGDYIEQQSALIAP